jgi:Na+-transporting methylmalonyl-CoA/oxaloacetate decarboxylase gamma subunit
VADFSQTESEVSELITKFGGYIAESKVDRTRGTQRTAKWVVRVPVDQLEEFLDAVVEIGVPETRDTNAQDVTEEYVDLEARIKNKREIERRVLKLLEDRSGDIKDVIAVESELGRVREEIERMEGRMRYLTNRISLTTVTITAREQQNYVPPQAPTFAAQIGQTWSGSVRTLKDFGQGLVLFVVGLAPWLPVLAFLVVPVVWLVRRLRRRPIGQPLSLPAARN